MHAVGRATLRRYSEDRADVLVGTSLSCTVPPNEAGARAKTAQGGSRSIKRPLEVDLHSQTHYKTLVTNRRLQQRHQRVPYVSLGSSGGCCFSGARSAIYRNGAGQLPNAVAGLYDCPWDLVVAVGSRRWQAPRWRCKATAACLSRRR